MKFKVGDKVLIKPKRYFEKKFKSTDDDFPDDVFFNKRSIIVKISTGTLENTKFPYCLELEFLNESGWFSGDEIIKPSVLQLKDSLFKL